MRKSDFTKRADSSRLCIVILSASATFLSALYLEKRKPRGTWSVRVNSCEVQLCCFTGMELVVLEVVVPLPHHFRHRRVADGIYNFSHLVLLRHSTILCLKPRISCPSARNYTELWQWLLIKRRLLGKVSEVITLAWQPNPSIYFLRTTRNGLTTKASVRIRR